MTTTITTTTTSIQTHDINLCISQTKLGALCKNKKKTGDFCSLHFPDTTTTTTTNHKNNSIATVLIPPTTRTMPKYLVGTEESLKEKEAIQAAQVAQIIKAVQATQTTQTQNIQDIPVHAPPTYQESQIIPTTFHVITESQQQQPQISPITNLQSLLIMTTETQLKPIAIAITKDPVLLCKAFCKNKEPCQNKIKKGNRSYCQVHSTAK
ncbi:MAG: hypothetical protein WD512_02960 [Candidatus Paceibacterota bacterium]